jgi:hypothetical protein
LVLGCRCESTKPNWLLELLLNQFFLVYEHFSLELFSFASFCRTKIVFWSALSSQKLVGTQSEKKFDPVIESAA